MVVEEEDVEDPEAEVDSVVAVVVVEDEVEEEDSSVEGWYRSRSSMT